MDNIVKYDEPIKQEPVRHQEQKIQIPLPQQGGNNPMDGIKLTLDNGGISAMFVRFLLWFIFPVAMIAGVIYFIYNRIYGGQQAQINVDKAKNESKEYKDGQTKWDFNVADTKSNTDVSNQIQQFENIAEKIKGAK